MHFVWHLTQRDSALLSKRLTFTVGEVEVKASVHINRDDLSFSSSCRLNILFEEPLARLTYHFATKILPWPVAQY